METKPAYGIEELAKAGPLGRTYLFQAIKEKRLIAHKAGRRTIITHENYQAFLRSLPVAGEQGKTERVEGVVCNTVRYIGREYQSPAQLAELIGGEDHLVWSDFQTHDMNGCLCSVDLEATLKRAGFDWRRSVDPMEWTAFKAT